MTQFFVSINEKNLFCCQYCLKYSQKTFIVIYFLFRTEEVKTTGGMDRSTDSRLTNELLHESQVQLHESQILLRESQVQLQESTVQLHESQLHIPHHQAAT